MIYLLIRLIINAIALYVATLFVPGLTFDGHWTTLAVVAFIFGLVNALVRPLLELLTCPLILLTLGLFTLVINALLLMLTGWVAGQLNLGFHVNDFVAAFIGALVISIISFLLNMFLSKATGQATA